MPTDNDSSDFAAMLAEFEREQPAPGRGGPQVGDMVRGVIVSIGAEAAFVDLGAKQEGMLELDEIKDRDGNVEHEVGDEVEARVVALDDRTGSLVLRRSLGRGPDAREELQQAAEHAIPVDGLVTGTNKGGFEVQVAGQRAFCPISQIDDHFVEEPESYVGQRFQFLITRYEPGRGKSANIVLSRRTLLEQAARAAAVETRKRLHEGAVLTGTVSSLKSYGEFIDLGGLEGMLHVSQIGFERIEHPGDVLAVGQQVEVQVLKIEQTNDPKRPERVSLSLKTLQRDPWIDATQRFVAGTKTAGEVVRVQPFGAFVEIAPGVEGLVHISELAANKRINHPREVVSPGDKVQVTVLSVDPARRRIALSMAATEVDAEAAIVDEYTRSKPVRKDDQSLGTFADLLKNSFPKE